MAHGTGDPIIPVSLGQQSADLLARSGAGLEWWTCEMGQSVGLDELRSIAAWLSRVVR